MYLYQCVLSFQSWSALCKYVFFILFIFYFFCYNSSCLIIFMSILNIYIFGRFMLIMHLAFLIVLLVSYSFVISKFNIYSHLIMLCNLPYRYFLSFFFVNNVIIIYSFQTYTQDNHEHLFSLLSDIYFQRALCINPHSNFICNSCVRDSTESKVMAAEIQASLYS